MFFLFFPPFSMSTQNSSQRVILCSFEAYMRLRAVKARKAVNIIQEYSFEYNICNNSNNIFLPKHVGMQEKYYETMKIFFFARRNDHRKQSLLQYSYGRWLVLLGLEANHGPAENC